MLTPGQILSLAVPAVSSTRRAWSTAPPHSFAVHGRWRPCSRPGDSVDPASTRGRPTQPGEAITEVSDVPSTTAIASCPATDLTAPNETAPTAPARPPELSPGASAMANRPLARPNTVQLGRGEDPDRLRNREMRVGPGTMLGPLDAVVAHLASDHPGGGAQPPSGQQLGADLADRADQGRGEVERGGAALKYARCVGPRAANG